MSEPLPLNEYTNMPDTVTWMMAHPDPACVTTKTTISSNCIGIETMKTNYGSARKIGYYFFAEIADDDAASVNKIAAMVKGGQHTHIVRVHAVDSDVITRDNAMFVILYDQSLSPRAVFYGSAVASAAARNLGRRKELRLFNPRTPPAYEYHCECAAARST
eukprot:SAG31_NODE_523_length_14545_cov_4.805067_10_plen_161_part_00